MQDSDTLVGQSHADFASDASDRYRAVLIKFFSRKLRNPSEAEDYAQEVLTRLVTSKAHDIKNPDAYVFQIAGNMTRDLYRRQAVRDRYVREQRADVGRGHDLVTPEQIVGDRRQLDQLIAAVEALPARTRRIFILCRFENMKIQTVAEMLDISPSTVKNHLSKALVRLTHIMETDTGRTG